MKFALILLACTCTLASVQGRPSHQKPQESQCQSSGQSQQSQSQGKQSQSQGQQSQSQGQQRQCQNQNTKSSNCNSGQQSQSQSSSSKTCSSQTSAPKCNSQSSTQTQKTGPNAVATSSTSNGKSTDGTSSFAIPFVSQGSEIFGAGLDSGTSALNSAMPLAEISSLPLGASSLAGFVPAGVTTFIPSNTLAGLVPTDILSTNSIPTNLVPANLGSNFVPNTILATGSNVAPTDSVLTDFATGSNVVPTGSFPTNLATGSLPDADLVTGSIPTSGIVPTRR